MVDKTAVFSLDNRIESPVYPHDVFTLTVSGQAEISSTASALPREALAILVMLDGKRSVGDLEAQIPQIGVEALRNLIRSLVAAQLVREVTMAEAGDLGIDFAAFFNTAGGAQAPSAGTRASADREAASGEPSLEQKGYYVSIARKALKPAQRTAALSALIVEDDPDVVALVKQLLEKAGFTVEAAGARAQIVARLNRTPLPDIVLLDVGLPDLSGFEVLQRIKTHPALKHIPVVMLTADARRESIVRGLTSGADGYITKPFGHEALVKGVMAVLGF